MYNFLVLIISWNVHKLVPQTQTSFEYTGKHHFVAPPVWMYPHILTSLISRRRICLFRFTYMNAACVYLYMCINICKYVNIQMWVHVNTYTVYLPTHTHLRHYLCGVLHTETGISEGCSFPGGGLPAFTKQKGLVNLLTATASENCATK